ncbi:MAG: restriction endonuclease, partial [Clostridia bacterium]|nr:restriction endonuclease [Clostridia bacterium]
MNKTAIKNFAVWARQKLIDDIKYKAGMLGITENGIAEKLPQSTADLHFYDIGTKNYSEISGIEIKQREALVKAIKTRERSLKNYKETFENVVEEVAYTWFNRLIAIRFMEVNDYLPSGVRVLSSENKAKNEPDFVTSPFDTDLEFTPYEQDRVIQLKDENKLDELFRMLFIKQCNKLHDILPELFETTDDYTELLLTISFTDKDGIVYRLVHDIDEDDFNIDKEGQVEIIGWMYQYYNIEPKDKVFSRPSGQKIRKEDIPAATQLFTPDWIVRYMVENSVGRIWIEGHPNDSLKDSWKYYIDEAEQEQQVVAKLEEIKATYKGLTPEKIKVIDPCMGSG